MLAIDVTPNATHMPIHQRLTLPSTSTPQFSPPPYNIHEDMQQSGDGPPQKYRKVLDERVKNTSTNRGF